VGLYAPLGAGGVRQDRKHTHAGHEPAEQCKAVDQLLAPVTPPLSAGAPSRRELGLKRCGILHASAASRTPRHAPVCRHPSPCFCELRAGEANYRRSAVQYRSGMWSLIGGGRCSIRRPTGSERVPARPSSLLVKKEIVAPKATLPCRTDSSAAEMASVEMFVSAGSSGHPSGNVASGNVVTVSLNRPEAAKAYRPT
jgi:hypothetical protein